MATCAKILLFIFNLIFVILGIVLIVSGVLVATSDNQDFDVLSTTNALLAPFSSVGILTIILGVLVFIIAFCGCCGAIKESKLLLTIFVVLLLIILIIEIVAAVLGYVFRSSVDSAVDEELMQGLWQYNYMENKTGGYTDVWNTVQMEAMCCGVNGPDDWKNAVTPKGEVGPTFPVDRMTPASCSCTTTDEDCMDSLWSTGCKDDFVAALLGNLAFTGTASVVIILAEIFGIIFACCVIRDADKETA